MFPLVSSALGSEAVSLKLQIWKLVWFWWLVTQTCKEKGRVVVREADSVRGWLNAHSCQCELWRLTSGGAPELRRRMCVRRIDSRDVCVVFSED